MKTKTKRVARAARAAHGVRAVHGARAARSVTKQIASKSATNQASHDEAERYFDAAHSRVFRSYLVNQLADLAQQECKPGESVVEIADHSVLESFPSIRVLKVTMRTKTRKLRHCFIQHPVLEYDADWFNRPPVMPAL